MKTIPLTQGKVAIVDDRDFEALSKYEWYAGKHRQNFYALRADYSSGKKTTIRMHRVILGAKPGEQVDHKDGDGLNNRRSNIRLCTSQQNAMNRRLIKKGVRRRTDRPNGKKVWLARITVGRKTEFLGFFRTQQEAEAAYTEAARTRFGEFAPQ